MHDGGGIITQSINPLRRLREQSRHSRPTYTIGPVSISIFHGNSIRIRSDLQIFFCCRLREEFLAFFIGFFFVLFCFVFVWVKLPVTIGGDVPMAVAPLVQPIRPAYNKNAAVKKNHRFPEITPLD
jgi:hypothetical protein